MADQPIPYWQAPNRKPTIGLVSSQIIALLAWVATTIYGIEIPSAIAMSASGLIAFILMYFIKEPQ